MAVEYDEALETAADYPPERAARMVRAALGLPGLEVAVRDVMPWQRSSQMADRMAEGRVFLAGDAAHAIPPNGGLGGQAAIQDAADLAWKIAFVLNRQAGPRLLETFATERYPVTERTLDRQTTVYLDRTRARGGPPRDGIEPGYLEVALGYRYRSVAVLDDMPDDDRLDEDPREPSGRPGTRLPHAPFEFAGKTISSLDWQGAASPFLPGRMARDGRTRRERLALLCRLTGWAAIFWVTCPDFWRGPGWARKELC